MRNRGDRFSAGRGTKLGEREGRDVLDGEDETLGNVDMDSTG